MPIPDGWTARVVDSGAGMVDQAPGATGNANMIRIMDSTDINPDGYIVIYRKHGQAVDANGKVVMKSTWHIPLSYVGTIKWPWE